MHFQWQFFENLNEIVYVSEIETESLVYMNARLRKVLGIDDSKEYIGKKCYQVLQGLSRPCDFCTNHLLKENEFYEWTYKNPILNRSYLIKDTVFKYEGKKYRLEIAIDIDSEKVQLNSYYFANTDEIIKNCMENMNSSADPNETIDNLLKFIGEKFLCERSYIFERNKIIALITHMNGVRKEYNHKKTYCKMNLKKLYLGGLNYLKINKLL